VSCGTDYIMAHPTSITGSIGVLFPLYDASGLLDKVGVEDRTVKSGDYKDITSPFAERTPEEWEQQKKLLSGVVQQMHEQFVSVVARGRNLDPEVVRKLADGRIYTSQDAQRFKLIDGVGYHEDAVAKVKELTGLTEVHVVEYRRTPSLKDLLLSHAGEREITVQLGSQPGVTYKKPMYLWDPAAR
jgi:protease-4